MANLLLVSGDAATAQELDALGQSSGFRTKSTFNPGAALEWLKLREFDIVVVEASVPLLDQQQMAAQLWRFNTSAPFVVIELDPHGRRALQEARLFGAEIITQPDALAKLKTLLDALRPRNPLAGDDFKILVVEDLDSPRDIICAFIEGLGFPSVTGVSSARAALQELESSPEKYSCVITDIRMPEISGKQLIEQIRIHDKLQHLPIIVLTAHGTGDCLVDCLKAGASGFLVKPPKKNDLSREIGRAVRIMAHHGSPRLASAEEAEQMREILSEKGF